MPRLYRPHVPLEVRCRVAMRQLGEMWPDDVLREVVEDRNTTSPCHRAEVGLRALLDMLLVKLSGLLGCAPDDLRLDHDPALAVRQRIVVGSLRVGGGSRVIYRPAANDPEHLIYRTKHAHHIKTNVRGDGAQHPDRVLIKKERRRQRATIGSKSSGFPKGRSRLKRVTKKRKTRSRPLRSASRWPPRGSRKVNWRRKSRDEKEA